MSERTLRDMFPIHCHACGAVIRGNDYRLLNIALHTDADGRCAQPPDGVYKHVDCLAPEDWPGMDAREVA